MFSQLFRKKKQLAFPMYTRLLQVPTQPLPPALHEREQHSDQGEKREEIQQRLLSQLQQSPPDAPLLTGLLMPNAGVVTIPLPEKGEHCLPIFSSPHRATDYVQMLLPEASRVSYLASNAGQFLQMLRDLEQVGITNIAVDRCPRCEVFTAIATQSLQSLADVHFILATSLATALHRANLYLAYAVEEVQQGRYDEALLVALETVGHVTVEDWRVHLLIAMLALARKDQRLLQEAKTLLSHFWAKEALENLAQMERTGTLDFTIFPTRMTE